MTVPKLIIYSSKHVVTKRPMPKKESSSGVRARMVKVNDKMCKRRCLEMVVIENLTPGITKGWISNKNFSVVKRNFLKYFLSRFG